MDVLKNKKYVDYGDINRYNNIPIYFNTVDKREVCGIGKNLAKTAEYYTHKLSITDTLDSLALKYYNNPTYWWVIAYFNDVQDPFLPLSEHYKTLKIPNISTIEFADLR